MKRYFYIFLAGLLGFMLGFILAVLIELPIISFIISTTAKSNQGLDLEKLIILQYIFTSVMVALGFLYGIGCGKSWWEYIYVEKKYTGRWIKIKNS